MGPKSREENAQGGLFIKATFAPMLTIDESQ